MTRTVLVNKKLLTGTVPVNNLFLILIYRNQVYQYIDLQILRLVKNDRFLVYANNYPVTLPCNFILNCTWILDGAFTTLKGLMCNQVSN